ncbi:Uncharacterized protein APZ42_029913 [Daphnia magna]|uniref:Integrase catalytic domain-containing protein n=1 Tax=Daphnia magna TaxID=35525 RepID=A0A164P732_9CRUS|nr:Uncharacterized protein APZ42_029913 [Daphnia magna]
MNFGMVSTDEDETEESTVLLIDSSLLFTEVVTCQGMNIRALIDTGAVVSVASPELQRKLQAKRSEWDGPSVVMVNGQKAPPIGAIELEIEHQGNQFRKLQINYDAERPELFLGSLAGGVVEELESSSHPRVVSKTGVASRTEDAIAHEVLKKQVSIDLPAVDTENLIDLLEEFGTCFTLIDGELGMCRKAEHCINTGAAAPVHQPPYKSSRKERAIVQEQVDEMEKKGVIEPSNSSWASPVVLVKKKDGSWRFRVDYRRLNAISVKDVGVSAPFERLGMDILGPFHLSKGGNTNIVVAIDYVTKWAETKALPRAGAAEVADFLVKCVLLRHGAPHQLTTDQGRCFMAEVTQKVLQAMETNHTPTTAYRPQANGLVERINHTLADMLSMNVSADHRNWDESLPFVTFAYNTSRQESTGRTPFYLVYGREAILPVDGALSSDPNLVPPHGQDPTEWALERLQRARHEVQRLSVTVHEKQKIRYDEGCREAPTYLPGEEVLFYKPVRKVGKSENLLHRWFGPYTIVRQTTPSNYELRRGRSPKSEIVHVERIKPFVDCVSSRPPAPVPTTTGGQPEESSGDPSPQAHADNREQEPPPEAEVTTPRPAVPLVEEGDGGPRRSVKIRAARKTFSLTFALFTFLTVFGELNLTSAKEVVAYQGVIFKSEGGFL